jgi:pimeloyl-ACP methyl ester carboxylesterase
MSMGGAIAQVVALDYPDRVASLTLISTSPSGGDPDLPEMSAETGAEFAAVASPDWSDRAAVIDYQLQLARVCASRSSPFDEEELRRLAGRVLDRTSNVEASMTNHDFLKGADPWRERLRDLDVPTLVIHGTEDRCSRTATHSHSRGRSVAPSYFPSSGRATSCPGGSGSSSFPQSSSTRGSARARPRLCRSSRINRRLSMNRRVSQMVSPVRTA